MSTRDNYKFYTETAWYGRKLLEKHTLDEYGLWNVKGEDPNCDWGGYHHMPDLGTYEGYLKDVIVVAIQLPGFWQWGAGGEITKVGVKQVTPDTISERNKKREELKEAEAKVAQLRKELELN